MWLGYSYLDGGGTLIVPLLIDAWKWKWFYLSLLVLPNRTPTKEFVTSVDEEIAAPKRLKLGEFSKYISEYMFVNGLGVRQSGQKSHDLICLCKTRQLESFESIPTGTGDIQVVYSNHAKRGVCFAFVFTVVLVPKQR
jgi:hypothetical protein